MKFFVILATVFSLTALGMAFFSKSPEKAPEEVRQPSPPDNITAGELASLLGVSRSIITLPGTETDQYTKIGLVVEYGDGRQTKSYGTYGPIPGGSPLVVLLQEKGGSLSYSLQVYGMPDIQGMIVHSSNGGIIQAVTNPFANHGNTMSIGGNHNYAEDLYLIKCSTDENAELSSNQPLKTNEIGLRLSATKVLPEG